MWTLDTDISVGHICAAATCIALQFYFKLEKTL